MKRFIVIAALLFMAVNNSLYAQPKNVTINGRITSFEESLPLEGVSVVVKGTRNGTGTQADGSFTLTIQPEDSVLQVSYSGYEKLELKLVSGKRDYDIVLKRGDGGVSVLAVMGYHHSDVEISYVGPAQRRLFLNIVNNAVQ